MSTLADTPRPADGRVLFCRLFEQPPQKCILGVLHSTNVRVKFETVAMVVLKELISMFRIALITGN